MAYDFDGENGSDFVIANGNGVNVYLNQGDGTFKALDRLAMGVGSAPSALILGQFDEDDKLDIAVLCPGTSQIVLLSGDGKGGFAETKVTDKIGEMTAGVAAKFTGGAKDDLVVYDSNTRVRLLTNDGKGTFSDSGIQDSFGGVAFQYSHPLAQGDINNDGRPDFAVIKSDVPNSEVLIYLLRDDGDGMMEFDRSDGKGKRSFTRQGYDSHGAPLNIATVDLKGDGWDDLVVGVNTPAVSSALTVLVNKNQVGKAEFDWKSVSLPDRPVSVAAATLDKDKNPDLVVSFQSKDFVEYHRGTDDGGFTPPLGVPYPVGKSAALLAAAPFDNGKDTVPDLLVVTSDRKYAMSSYNRNVQAEGQGTWTSLNSPSLQTLTLNSIAVHPTDSNVWLEGAHDNGVGRTENSGTLWTEVRGGDGGMVRFDPTDGDYAYSTLQKGMFARSADGGKTWNDKSIEGWTDKTFPFYSKFAIDAKDSKWIAHGAKGVLYMTDDRGDEWKVVGPSTGGVATIDSDVTAVAFSAKNDNWIYVGYRSGRLVRTENKAGFANEDRGDKAKYWKVADQVDESDETSQPFWGRSQITGLALDPMSEKKLFVITGQIGNNRVNYSIDGGDTWKNVTGDLTKNYRPMSVALENRTLGGATTQYVYVGTDAGVFVGENKAMPGANPDFTWTKLKGDDDKLPPVRITDLVIQGDDNNRYLAAATYGRGAWKIDLIKNGEVAAAHSVGGHGFRDFTGNGLFDGADTLLANVGVQLRQGSTVVATSMTDASGWYRFDNVANGTYTVHFSAPSGLGFTAQNAGSDDWLDSDANSSGVAAVTVAGASWWNIDAGFVPVSTVAGQAWRDLDKDGKRGTAEPLLANVGVQLRKGSTVVANTTTNTAGHYQFDNVADGDYTVRFTAPSGLGFTAQDVGSDDWIDSDPNMAGDAAVTVAGASWWNVDAGFVALPGTVAGTVWRDLNAKGQQNAGEYGLAGWVVKLYDATTNAFVASATTNAVGDYIFAELAANKYYLSLVPPPGWSLTAANVGDDSKDSDFDKTSKSTAHFDLTAGLYLDFDAGLLFGMP